MPLCVRAISAGFAWRGEHASRPSLEAIARAAVGTTLPGGVRFAGAVRCPWLTAPRVSAASARHARPVLSSRSTRSFDLSGAFDAYGASCGG